MRGMDNGMSSDTTVEGHRIFYNCIRPHMGLNGKTPAETAGIDLKFGTDKSIEVIKEGVSNEKEAKLKQKGEL